MQHSSVQTGSISWVLLNILAKMNICACQIVCFYNWHQSVLQKALTEEREVAMAMKGQQEESLW